MQGTSRMPFFALVGALTVLCLAGTGCETANNWNAPNPLTLVGLDASLGTSRSSVVMLPPRPIDDDMAIEPVTGPGYPPARVASAATVAGRGEAVPLVWRASPRDANAGRGEDDAGPVAPASWSFTSSSHRGQLVPAPSELPRELNKVTLPPYRIEPPDVLVINALRVVPRPPYKIEPLDELLIQAPPAQVLPNEPIGGTYPVGPDGQVDLGHSYGKVIVMGLTPEQARAAIGKHVADHHGIKPPAVSVALGRTRGPQQVRGEHPVRMDGTVDLGIYGEAYVAGMTLSETRHAVETQLAKKLLNPEVTVDVAACNSKVYYVIYDGGHYGQQIFKFPVVGGETVLDAISELRRLPATTSTTRVWIARPVPGEVAYRQIMPVDWAAITEGGATTTNYQIFPGDRIFVKADHGSALHDGMSRMAAPFERLFGCASCR